MIVLKLRPCLTEKAKWMGTMAVNKPIMSGEALVFGAFQFILEMIISSIFGLLQEAEMTMAS